MKWTAGASPGLPRLLLAVPLLVPLLVGSLVAASPAGASVPAPDPSTRNFEIRFMEMTIDHHLLGVEMGELCVRKATPPPPAGDERLRQICQQIIQDQSQEAEQLRTWLRQWYGIEHEGRVAQPGTLQRIERLSGERFDIEISEMFIKHHLRQIRESEECLERAFHEELRQLCEHMIQVQSQQIQEFRAILAEHSEDTSGRR